MQTYRPKPENVKKALNFNKYGYICISVISMLSISIHQHQRPSRRQSRPRPSRSAQAAADICRQLQPINQTAADEPSQKTRPDETTDPSPSQQPRRASLPACSPKIDTADTLPQCCRCRQPYHGRKCYRYTKPRYITSRCFYPVDIFKQ